MSKRSGALQEMAFCGLDVSAATLSAAVQPEGSERIEQHEFANTAAGHRQLIAWLGKQATRVRVTLEATGVYSLDAALALDAAEGIEVAVLNPKQARRFAETLGRSKTDRADAMALAEYSLRMRFVRWQRPSMRALELRAIARHIGTLSAERTSLHNRLHAASSSSAAPACVRQQLKRSIAHMDKAIVRMRAEALARVKQDPALWRKFELLIGVRGIGETSAVQLLSELAGLDPAMTARQWVASSGLDPVEQSSGSSVRKPARISRHGNRYLRRALYMPALVAVQRDPHCQAFYLALQARHKTKLQALMAVARKLLHAIFGIFKTGTQYDGAKLFPQIKLPTS
jgi:transposase